MLAACSDSPSQLCDHLAAAVVEAAVAAGANSVENNSHVAAKPKDKQKNKTEEDRHRESTKNAFLVQDLLPHTAGFVGALGFD